MAEKKTEKKTDEAKSSTPFEQAIGAVRTPVYAYVGANDLAIEAITGIVNDLRVRAEEAVTETQKKVTDTVTEARTKATETVTGARTKATETVTGARTKATETVNEARTRATEAPAKVQSVPSELQSLLEKYRPEELKKVAEAYVQVAAGIYNGLAARGEDVVTRLREENPQLEAGLSRVNDGFTKAAGAVEERVELGEETLGNVARQTRSLGAKAASRVSKGAQDAADEVEEKAQSAADSVDKSAKKASDKVQSAAAKTEAKTVSKPAAKKTTAKKAPAKSTAKKAPAKKAPAKSTAKKTTAKKAPAKKAPAKKTTGGSK